MDELTERYKHSSFGRKGGREKTRKKKNTEYFAEHFSNL
jgi:hypothetical protein